ncbi:MAG: apolipoprotein N-acyltransferase [Candidatus Omnitrophica bacterium]|nr:apolipoprotein N-acyltransferase [Candidatus Omnitrophota bacterium]
MKKNLLFRRELFPFYSFILFTLAFPKFNLWPLAWFCLVPILIFLQQETKWWKLILLPLLASLIPSFSFSFGLHHFSLGDFLCLILIQALFSIPLSVILRFVIVKGRNLPRVFLIGPAFIWIAYEICRSTIPALNVTAVGLLGYSQGHNLPILQFASIFGVYGISFLVLLGNGAFYLLVRPLPEGEKRDRLFPCIMIGLIALVALNGTIRLYTKASPNKHIKVGLIQPNITLPESWDAEKLEARANDIVAKLIRLTKEAAKENPDLIVIPERSFPGAFNEEGNHRVQQIKDCAKEIGIPLIIGAIYQPDAHHANRYNSAYFVSAKGTIIDRYDKIALFPVGEYLPGAEIIDGWINKYQVHKQFPMVFGIHSRVPKFRIAWFMNAEILTPGTKQNVFTLDTIGRFATPICIEDVFSTMCRKFMDNGAELLVLISNDAWVKKAPLLEHHVLCTVMRAVENNVSFVRATNTGITAMILPNGRIDRVFKNEEGEGKMVEGYLVGEVPLSDGKTFFNQYGHFFQEFCVVFAILFIIFTIAIPTKAVNKDS